MKRTFLITALLTAGISYLAGAQDNSLFSFSNTGYAREISKLGTNPEFPFLRMKASKAKFMAALNASDNSTLNNILMSVGFENGAKDVKAENVTSEYLPVGTTGNMGSGGYNNMYARLSGDPSEFKAWKISSDNNRYVYFMYKCGNAFYPNSAKSTSTGTACITAPVKINADANEMTLTATGQKITSGENVYIYYHKKHHRKHEKAYPIAGLDEKYPSAPVLLNASQKVNVVPETYKVSVTARDNSVSVCNNSTLNIAANVNLEKTSSYAGYYPSATKEYKKVSKHVYKKSERKMRKAERKEKKIARMTGMAVKKCPVS